MADDNSPNSIGPDRVLNSEGAKSTESREEKSDSKGISTSPNGDSFSDAEAEEEEHFPTLEEAEQEIADLLTNKKKTRDIVTSSIRTNDLNFNAFNSMFSKRGRTAASVTKMPAWFTRNLNTASLLKIQDFQRTVQTKYMRKSLSLAYRRTYLLKGMSKSLVNIGDILSRKTDAVKVNTGISASVDAEGTNAEANQSFLSKALKDTGIRFAKDLLTGKTVKEALSSRQQSIYSKIDTAKEFLPEGKFARLNSILDRAKKLTDKFPTSSKLFSEDGLLQKGVSRASELFKTFAPSSWQDKFKFLDVEQDKKDLFGKKNGHRDFLIEWRTKQFSLLDSIREALGGKSVDLSRVVDKKDTVFDNNSSKSEDEKLKEAKHEAVMESLRKPYKDLKNYYSRVSSDDINKVKSAANDNISTATANSYANDNVRTDNPPTRAITPSSDVTSKTSVAENVKSKLKENESKLNSYADIAKSAIYPTKEFKPVNNTTTNNTTSFNGAPNFRTSPFTIQQSHQVPTIVRVVTDRPNTNNTSTSNNTTTVNHITKEVNSQPETDGLMSKMSSFFSKLTFPKPSEETKRKASNLFTSKKDATLDAVRNLSSKAIPAFTSLKFFSDLKSKPKPHEDNKQTTTSINNNGDKEAKVDKAEAFDFLEEARRRKSMEHSGGEDGEEGGSFLGSILEGLGEDAVEGAVGKSRLGRRAKLFFGKGKRRIRNLFKGKAGKELAEGAAKKGLFRRGISSLGRAKSAIGSLFKKKAAASTIAGVSTFAGGKGLKNILGRLAASPWTGLKTAGNAISELGGGRSLGTIGRLAVEGAPGVIGSMIAAPFRWGTKGLEKAVEMGGAGLAKEVKGKTVGSLIRKGLWEGTKGVAKASVAVPAYLGKMAGKGLWGGTKALFTKPVLGRSVAGHVFKGGWEGTKLLTRGTLGLTGASAGLLGRGLWGATKLGGRGLKSVAVNTVTKGIPLLGTGLAKGAWGAIKAPGHFLANGLGKGILKGSLGGIIGGLAVDHATHLLDRHTQQGSLANVLGHIASSSANGALTGSIIPGWGTIVGGIAGAGYGLYSQMDNIKAGFGSFFHTTWGKNPKIDANGNLKPDPKSTMGRIQLGLDSTATNLEHTSASFKAANDNDKEKPEDQGASSSGGSLGSSNSTPGGSGDGGIGSSGGGGGAPAPVTATDQAANGDITSTTAYKDTYKALPKDLQSRIDKSTNPALKYTIWTTGVQFGAKTAVSMISDVYKANPKADDRTFIDGVFQKRSTSLVNMPMKNQSVASGTIANQRQLALDIQDGKNKGDYQAMASSAGNTDALSADQYKARTTVTDPGNVVISNNGFKARGTRNNNPGNINFVHQKGAVLEVNPWKKPRFAHFASMRDGILEIRNQLLRYQKNWNKHSIWDMISTWAPAKDGNNPMYYANEVGKQLGVSIYDKSVDMKNTKVATEIAKGIAHVENGAEGKKTWPMIEHIYSSIPNGTDEIPLSGTPDNSMPGMSSSPAQTAVPVKSPNEGDNKTKGAGDGSAPTEAPKGQSTPKVVPPAKPTVTARSGSAPSITPAARLVSSPNKSKDDSVAAVASKTSNAAKLNADKSHEHLSNIARNTAESAKHAKAMFEYLKPANSGNSSPVVNNFINNASTNLSAGNKDSLSMSNGRRGYSHVG